MPDISILIPIRVGGGPFEFLIRHLTPCLEAVLRQEGVSVDAVVTDLGSPSPYDLKIQEICRTFGILLTRAENDGWNLSKARNVGAGSAQTDKFLFIDCDCILPSEYARRHAETLVAGTFTFSHFLDTKPGTPAISDMETLRPFLGIPRTCSQSHVGIMRGDFETVGGYDERFKGYGGEDNDFWLRMEMAGLHPVYVDSHPVHISHPGYGNNMRVMGLGKKVDQEYEENKKRYWKTYEESRRIKRERIKKP